MARPIVQQNSHPSQPTRRALLASAALVAPARLLPAVADCRSLQSAPDPHPAWWASREAARAEINRPGRGDTGDEDPVFARMVELEELLAGTQARTLAGLRAQLAFLAHECDGFGPPIVTDGLENALATVERLAGEGRA